MVPADPSSSLPARRSRPRPAWCPRPAGPRGCARCGRPPVLRVPAGRAPSRSRSARGTRPGRPARAGAARPAGGQSHILVLGLDPARAHLDPDQLAIDHDRLDRPAAGQRSPVVSRTPERSGLRPEHVAELGDLDRIAQHVDHVSGPALLHHHRATARRRGRRPRAGADGVGQLLAGGVVDVGLEERHGLAGVRPRGRRDRRSPPGRCRRPVTTWVQLGSPSSSRRPAPKPWRRIRMAGSGPNPAAERGQDGGAGRAW